jgi:nucleoside triphosphate pyrophosphatase
VKPIVLASQSPRRRALLEALGAEIEVRVSQAEEIDCGAPDDVVLTNAVAKRDAVAHLSQAPELIIAADTIVVLDDTILGKPVDLDEARGMLSRLSGRTHEVLTGVAVIDTETGRTAEGVETTRVTFCTLTPNEIDRFVEAVNPVDRAGAYTVDGPGSLLVSRYDGCYQNVLGLPLVRLNTLLQILGEDLFLRVNADRAQFL